MPSRKSNNYRSGFEAKIAENLKKRKIKFKYETNKIKYQVPESSHTYIPDFELPSGIIVEAKGKFDPEARKKMKLIKEQYPDLDIRILFMRDQPIRKGSKTLYSDWCTANDYQFAFKEIPSEWI